MQRLAPLVTDEGVVLVLVGMADNHLVGVDHREAPGLDVLLLRQCEQDVEEALVHLEHLDELDQAPVGDVQLAVEPVGPRVGLGADLADRREVDATDQLGDILALRIRGREGADADAVLLGESDAHDRHILMPPGERLARPAPGMIRTALGLLELEAAPRAELALDVDPVLPHQLIADRLGHQMQRLLVHRAALDGVDRAAVSAGVLLEAALELGDDGRLPTADRPHQEQDALAYFEPLRCRAEVLDDLLERLLESEDLVGEELVADPAIVQLLDAGIHDHVVDPGMRELSDLRVLEHQLEIVGEGAFPVQPLLLGPVRLESFNEPHH
ncbi:hypothetical protein HRbin26_02314 [bacterium HR26]|nr:hypothetical protein HRbin26_02314 [bacterium HR26]